MNEPLFSEGSILFNFEINQTIIALALSYMV